ncbi:sigma-54-dependent transcriptional regulator [Enterococcus sp. JM9B]|uniref:sigma-54-dependent transcriptional regulator n=1 Tax=Enterococcus sp. JM9B TaxID=1857216 RepID=UPI001374A297|nr:sigma-54-dependent transcriptional regulator [Enterococcus sp. JM9B]KAF1301317.1 transcription antiterminator BglG [Enterococcus sp. JM9B]
MSKRIDRIYQYVLQQMARFSGSEEGNFGITTQEVAEVLAIQRTNASKDLNELVRQNRLKKIDGRPVRYAAYPAIQPPAKKHVVSYKEEQIPRELAQPQFVSAPIAVQDIFTRIVGANNSMKNAVEQAKAAILYPPKGLNCLITGPTGSGKTYFAHVMFQFAKSNHVIDEEKELIVFNCADYANNPELLMSHLFGYVKGAFTGAEQEKIGIIDQANGGMLFLDEIHRLPPEGQEMIFYFMDHGTYSRLGETGKNHQADVRIVGATTEDPNSSLLDTFVRRIPINIQLPSFEQRPASEKVDLVKIMVAQEANRIQRKISLTEDVIKVLIGSVSYGNIGQLKSNIQLVCARGFLNHMQHEEITITMTDLPEGIRSGLSSLANRRENLAELSKILEPKIVISPNESLVEIRTDSYELPYNLYDIIGDKAALLKADGLDQEAINHFISTDINIHLKSFYKDHGFSFNAENKLSEFVDQKIIDATNRIYEDVRRELGYEFQQNFVYAMSLHISSFLKKINDGEERHTNDNIRQMVAGFPEEFAMAKKIRRFIGKTFQVIIPESEDYYLAVLLISLRAHQTEGKIGVVVAAHGHSTASSMVQVVQQLLEVDQVAAVDMPLDMSPKVALEKIKNAVVQVNDKSGVMLLVDMGSLATFNEEIIRETGIEVRTVDMVTTAVVLETVRKASVLGTDLESLYESLEKFQGYGRVLVERDNHRAKQAILAICASGEGTAQRIKEIIQRSLSKKQEQELTVVPLSVVNLKSELPKIQETYHLIAATGIVDPKISAPFIPLDRFIDQDVGALLDRILVDKEPTFIEGDFQLNEEKATETAIRFMEESFTYINPQKLFQPIWNFVVETVKDAGFSQQEYGLEINLALHTAGMIERILVRQPLTVDQATIEKLLQDSFYQRLHLHVQSLERFLRLEVPEAEEYFLMEIIHTHQEKQLLLEQE